MMKLEIQQQLVASTGHVTEQDAELLKEEALNRQNDRDLKLVGVYDKYKVGWWVWVPSDPEFMETCMENAKEAGYSEAFTNLIQFARKNNCDWIMLDADGPKIEGLPTFSW